MEYLLNEPWLLGLLLAFVLAGAIELGRLTAARLHIHEDTNRKDQMVAIRDGLYYSGQPAARFHFGPGGAAVCRAPFAAH